MSAAGAAHLERLARALAEFQPLVDRAADWGEELGRRLGDGARLLAAGNGGSAAQAQHLTAELVGRYLTDRRPVSAIALHADTSSTTAIGNDYGADAVFSRQVEAHGRAGDVLVLLSTSGKSPNVLAAAEAGRRLGVTTWAFTGAAPNPLAAACDDSISVPVEETPTVQELHLVALHVLCEAAEQVLLTREEVTG